MLHRDLSIALKFLEDPCPRFTNKNDSTSHVFMQSGLLKHQMRGLGPSDPPESS